MILRSVTRKDLDLLLAWRNDPETRANSNHHDIITIEEHTAWFNKFEPKRYLYIAEVQGTPVGTCRADYLGNNTYELSWTIAPEHRRKGYGSEMVELLMHSVPRQPPLFKVHILEHNEASKKIAQRLHLIQ